jgi:hypothetical protein
MKQKSNLTRTLLIVIGLIAGHIFTSIFYSGVKDGAATAHAMVQTHK